MAVLQEHEGIAQDLHAGSIQSLYAVSLSHEDSAELLETEPEQLAERIDHAIESIHDTIRDISASSSWAWTPMLVPLWICWQA